MRINMQTQARFYDLREAQNYEQDDAIFSLLLLTDTFFPVPQR